MWRADLDPSRLGRQVSGALLPIHSARNGCCTELTDSGVQRVVGVVGDSRLIGIKCVWVAQGKIN